MAFLTEFLATESSAQICASDGSWSPGRNRALRIPSLIQFSTSSYFFIPFAATCSLVGTTYWYIYPITRSRGVKRNRKLSFLGSYRSIPKYAEANCDSELGRICDSLCSPFSSPDQVTRRRAMRTGMTALDEQRARIGYVLFCRSFWDGKVHQIAQRYRLCHEWSLPHRPRHRGYLLPNGNLFCLGRGSNEPRDGRRGAKHLTAERVPKDIVEGVQGRIPGTDESGMSADLRVAVDRNGRLFPVTAAAKWCGNTLPRCSRRMKAGSTTTRFSERATMVESS